jgi:nucleoside-diphosphate-sugar epimerase
MTLDLRLCFFVACAVVKVLLEKDHGTTPQSIYCLVRPSRVEFESAYWSSFQKKNQNSASKCMVYVLPYDMQDGGATLAQVLEQASASSSSACVYHIASVFGPSEDPIQSAMQNVKGTENVIQTMATFKNCRLVLTSSMAAVRGTGQNPLNGKFYTNQDWNTVSEIGENWGGCYQWSKAESERRAWELSKALGVPMASICPSFVFGPPADLTGASLSSSFSIKLVGQWMRGESPVQSRLCVDVRDVAQAHVAAGIREEAIGERFIVSTECRVPSFDLAEALRDVCRQTGLGDASKITHDSEFKGGAIGIGDKEVEATERLKRHLGIHLRPVEKT